MIKIKTSNPFDRSRGINPWKKMKKQKMGKDFLLHKHFTEKDGSLRIPDAESGEGEDWNFRKGMKAKKVK